jgi:AcrR family transcriptional regulator
VTPEAHASLRQKILEEAIGLISSEGVAGVTMRALASKLGYSPATIYLYFRNKEDLFQEIARYAAARLLEATEPCEHIADAAAARDAFVRAVLDFAFRHPALYQILTSVDLTPYLANPALESPGRRVLDRLRDLYARGAAAGQLHSENPEHDVVIDYSLVHGFLTLLATGTFPPPRLQGVTVGELREVIVDAIRRRSAPLLANKHH